MTKHTNRVLASAVIAFAIVLVGVAAETRTLLELPVSAVSNKVYLSSMTERPWWNENWQKRVPLLVSGQADVVDDKVVVDAIVDFDERVKPEDIRVVTPWETEIPCACEKVGDKKVRLLFKTRLRIHENRPFLVYYDRRDVAGAPSEASIPEGPGVWMRTTDDAFHLNNGVVDVVFDRRHATESLIRSMRIVGSNCQTIFFDGANGYAKNGFVFSPNDTNTWDAGEVVLDTPLAKSIRFSCPSASVTFTLYDEQPRLDWAYELNRGDGCSIAIKWGLGTGSAWDDFFYFGKAGKILTQRAGLDATTDCITPPYGRFENWLGEGWYAIGERRMPDIAGLVFDVKSVSKLEYDSYYSVSSRIEFSHKLARCEKARGSGALVATLGNVEDFRKIARRIEKPIVVSVGEAQAKVVKPHKIPRLDRDWCCDYNVGYATDGGCGDSGTAKPVEKDPMWAKNVCDRMRSYGSTAVCVMGYPWWMMPIRDKALFDCIIGIQKSGAFESWVGERTFATWEDMQKPGQGEGVLQFFKAIHDAGMAANTWTSEVPGWATQVDQGSFMPELNDIAVLLQSERVKEGQDCAYSFAIYHEGIHLPRDLVKKNGSTSYWTWKNPQEAFDVFDRQHTLVKSFYEQFKKLHPNVPVFLWNSENGSIDREKFMSEDEGYFDSVVVEMLPMHGISHTKHCAKRMRSHFNNRVGHTVWHHYYVFDPKTVERIMQIEWPFIFGINGYSQENLTYEAVDLESSEFSADFFRFAEYTRLGEKVARMAPVKNLGVYRDPKAYRADIIEKRHGKPYAYLTQHDGRVRSFSELKNFNYDVIGPKYFTAKDLAQYRVVYVPEDETLRETEARELVAYVKAGGSAIIEGVTVEKFGKLSGRLKDGVIASLGKGKMLWYKECRTDRLVKRDGRAIAEVRKAIADMGGIEPYTLKGSVVLDGNLQAGPDGMFLGLYNAYGERQTGTVTLNSGIQELNRSDVPLYVLDVKNGTRQLVVSNAFTVACEPQQCAFYLIGDDAFTAIPKTRDCAWAGSVATAFRPRTSAETAKLNLDFKPTVVVEFTRADERGEPVKYTQTIEAKYDIRAFTAKTFDAKACAAAIAEAKLVHFVDAQSQDADLVFANCAEALKGLLKRGGTILVTRTETGPAAQAFFKSVDVFDPNPSATRGIGDTWAVWCGGENHPYLTADTVVFAKEPVQEKDLFLWQAWNGVCSYFQYGRVFAKWDPAKQQRLFIPKVDGEKYAALVVQEKVLGAGRVIFSENQRSFTDWYESKRFVRNLLAYIMGEKPSEHAQKVIEKNGGIGDVYVETRTKGWQP